jgi:hypothetical protein
MSVPKEVRANRLSQVIVEKSQNNFGDQVEKYRETLTGFPSKTVSIHYFFAFSRSLLLETKQSETAVDS